MSAKATSTGTKLTAFSQKQAATPNVEMITPPIAGPTMRAVLNNVELRATAFCTSAGTHQSP